MRASRVGLSCWMNDSKVDAPIRSPAAANTVFGLAARSCLTAPERIAAPAVTPLVVPPVPSSLIRRPWKSLVARTWMVTGAACAGADVAMTASGAATSPVRVVARASLRPDRDADTTMAFRQGDGTNHINRAPARFLPAERRRNGRRPGRPAERDDRAAGLRSASFRLQPPSGRHVPDGRRHPGNGESPPWCRSCRTATLAMEPATSRRCPRTRRRPRPERCRSPCRRLVTVTTRWTSFLTLSTDGLALAVTSAWPSPARCVTVVEVSRAWSRRHRSSGRDRLLAGRRERADSTLALPSTSSAPPTIRALDDRRDRAGRRPPGP